MASPDSLPQVILGKLIEGGGPELRRETVRKMLEVTGWKPLPGERWVPSSAATDYFKRHKIVEKSDWFVSEAIGVQIMVDMELLAVQRNVHAPARA